MMNTADDDDHKIKKKQWQKVDDAKLRQLIQKNGTRNWSLIAEAIPGRTGKQCRERWHNHLDASIVKADWTPEEDEIIETMQMKLGNQWAKITKMLPGRTDNAVKNRFHLTKRARIRFHNRIFRNRHISAPEPSTIYNVIPSDCDDHKVIQQPSFKNSLSQSSDQPMNISVKNEIPQTSHFKVIHNESCLPLRLINYCANPPQNLPCGVNQTEYNNSGNNGSHNIKLQSSLTTSNIPPPPAYMLQPPRILTYFHNDTDLDCVSTVESNNELEFDINCFSHHEELRVIDNYTPKYKPIEAEFLPSSSSSLSNGHYSLSASEW